MKSVRFTFTSALATGTDVLHSVWLFLPTLEEKNAWVDPDAMTAYVATHRDGLGDRGIPSGHHGPGSALMLDCLGLYEYARATPLANGNVRWTVFLLADSYRAIGLLREQLRRAGISYRTKKGE